MGQMMIPRLPQGNRTIALMLLAAMLLCIAIYARVGWRVVIDPWTTAQVTANAGAQKLIEDKHNERLDTISAKQQKIMQYTATMEGIKELYQLSMTNIRGFGEESAYYKEIYLCATEILMDLPTVTKYIAKNPVKNYPLCLNEIADVAIEVEGLVHTFVDVVNNGKVLSPKNKVFSKYFPQTGGRYSMGQGDGYNFLDHYDRLTLANSIYSRLLNIKYKMDAMVMMCQFGSWGDVFFAIDPESWAAVYQGTSMVDGIINDWNHLGV